MRGVSDGGTSTFFADIDSLPAAHYALVSLDGGTLAAEPVRYWRPVYDASITDRAEAAGLLRERFVDSIRLHLRSDVPVGTMLSGGIDSSAIVGTMRHLLGPAAELHSFSFVSPGDPLDETPYIRLMAASAATVAHEVQASAETFLADVDHLIGSQAEPFGSTSIYAQYCVARAARGAGIKVLLDGQGSDELFAGYRFYLGARCAGLLAAGEPLRAARVLAGAARLPGVRASSTLFHTLSALDLPGARSLASAAEARREPMPFLDPRWLRAHASARPPRRLPRRLALLERLQNSLETDVLPGLLRYEDRNTMAFSIEARVPFLDVPLAELACRLSPELLVDDNAVTKAALRDALRGLVPAPILDRRDKIGFATPEARWLGAAAQWIDREVAACSAERLPFIDAAELEKQLIEVRNGSHPWQSGLWRVISLLTWTRSFGVDHDKAGN
jgi:asparagine synthase (glutamine-hydrolysing)